MHVSLVAGTVTDVVVIVPSCKKLSVVWSPPVPPNGVILHYNVIITRADTGENVHLLNTSNTRLTVRTDDFLVEVEVSLSLFFSCCS